MSTDTEKQFAGNYVRLVNKSRSLEQRVILQDKMIELMAVRIWAMQISSIGTEYKKSDIIKDYTEQALSELVTEQNKKAADNASM